MPRYAILIHVVVGIVINSEGKLLVGLRPDNKPYAGYWEFPGGKVETQETPRQALVRELAEELGIEVELAEAWFQDIHQYPDKTVMLDVWKVTRYQGEPQSMEGQQLAWVNPDELKSLHILEGNYKIIEQIQSGVV